LPCQDVFNVEQRPTEVQIHGFSDASDLAFAVVLYMRLIHNDGNVEVRIIAAKTKVTPLKKQSIPQLELLGALTLATQQHHFFLTHENSICG